MSQEFAGTASPAGTGCLCWGWPVRFSRSWGRGAWLGALAAEGFQLGSVPVGLWRCRVSGACLLVALIGKW